MVGLLEGLVLPIMVSAHRWSVTTMRHWHLLSFYVSRWRVIFTTMMFIHSRIERWWEMVPNPCCPLLGWLELQDYRRRRECSDPQRRFFCLSACRKGCIEVHMQLSRIQRFLRIIPSRRMDVCRPGQKRCIVTQSAAIWCKKVDPPIDMVLSPHTALVRRRHVVRAHHWNDLDVVFSFVWSTSRFVLCHPSLRCRAAPFFRVAGLVQTPYGSLWQKVP